MAFFGEVVLGVLVGLSLVLVNGGVYWICWVRISLKVLCVGEGGR